MRSGVYQIRNSVNGKLYVGSATDFEVRWNNHVSELNRKVHHNPYLQRAWLKYGPDAFRFELLEICELGSVVTREQHWIDTLGVTQRDVGYNIVPRAGTTRGMRWRPESRSRLSQTLMGHHVSDETRKRMSEAARRRVATPESKKRLVQRLHKVALSPEGRQSNSLRNKRYAQTEAGRAKLLGLLSLALNAARQKRRKSII